MKIGNWLKICEWTTVVFGTGDLRRFVLFECKYLFSIYFNIWNVVEHDRFHTHAFSSISFFLRGSYEEEQMTEGYMWEGIGPGKQITRHTFSAPLVRFIPRTNNHRMLLSTKNAITVTLAGPWDRMWSETDRKSFKTRVLGWGRKVVAAEPNGPGGK